MMFEIEGKQYHRFPSLEQFVSTLELPSGHAEVVLLEKFKEINLTHFSELYLYTKRELKSMLNVNSSILNTVMHYLALLRRRTKLVLTSQEIKNQQYSYLTSTNEQVNELLYNGGHTGLRSQSLVEIYGSPYTGKSKLIYEFAAKNLLRRDGKNGVLIVDSGDVSLADVQQVCYKYNVPQELVDGMIYYSKIHTFDEIETVMRRTAQLIIDKKIGLIIIDSLISPLLSQYPLDEEDNLDQLIERQQHLRRVCDYLRALSQLFDLVILYSNLVREDNEPLGGYTLAHIPDIRMKLMNNILTIVDCAYLPRKSINLMNKDIKDITAELF